MELPGTRTGLPAARGELVTVPWTVPFDRAHSHCSCPVRVAGGPCRRGIPETTRCTAFTVEACTNWRAPSCRCTLYASHLTGCNIHK